MKRIIAIMVLSFLPLTANADWVGGVGYFNLSDDEGGVDISLGALAASLGYRIDSGSNFFWMPEVRVGFGLGDDSVFGVDVEIETVVALSVRGQYDYDSGMYLFAAPSYANLDIKASSGGVSASEDDWEFGIGGGLGYKFNDQVSGELSYETFDGTDVFGVALKILFQ